MVSMREPMTMMETMISKENQMMKREKKMMKMKNLMRRRRRRKKKRKMMQKRLNKNHIKEKKLRKIELIKYK